MVSKVDKKWICLVELLPLFNLIRSIFIHFGHHYLRAQEELEARSTRVGKIMLGAFQRTYSELLAHLELGDNGLQS